MEIKKGNLGKIKSVPENESLPIKHVEEIIESAVITGRMMGLFAEISKRTDTPITFEDEILKKDNIMLHAFLRVVSVITKEEQRVLNALMDESKWLQENLKSESSDGRMRSLLFVQGWKLEANEIFANGGNMYDLLVFTDREFLTIITNKTLVNGYRGKLPNALLHIFSDNGQKGLKDTEDNIVIEAKYDDIHSSGWTGRGWFLCKDGKWGALNERLEWMFPMEYEAIRTRYEGGHYLKKNGKMAFCDENGKMVTDFLYEDMENYSSSWQGFKVKLNGKWGYIDGDGKEVIPAEYDYINLCSGGNMIKVKKDNLYGYYNMEDNSKLELQFEQACDFYSSHPDEAEVKINGQWGIIDRKGNYIIPAEYDSVNIDSSNVYRVKKDELEGIINKDKEILFPFKYKSLSSFNKDGIAVVQNRDGLYGYIDKKDNLFIEFQFENARNFDGDYAEVAQGYRKTGAIDKTGKVVVPMKYDDIHIRWDDIIEVELDDRNNRRYVRGLYDIKTGHTLPCIYEHISPMGRDKDGIMLCRCKKYGMTEEIKERVVSRTAGVKARTNNRRTFCIKYRENERGVSIIDIFDKTNLSTNAHPGLITEVEVVNSVLYIPEHINGHLVKEIESCSCWTDKSILKCVIFPQGLRRIGGEAFMAHPTLETVIIQDGIVRIEDSAFANCPNLKNVILGGGRMSLLIPSTPLNDTCIHRLAFNLCSPDLTFYIPLRYIDREYDRYRFRHVLPREDYEYSIVEQYMSSENEIGIASSESCIAIARDFAVILKQNGWELELLGRNDDFRQLCRYERRTFKKLAAGFDSYMALTDDGRVVAGPHAREFKTRYLIERLTDVVDISACEGHVVTLHSDGTVTCIDEPVSYEGPQPFANEVRDWSGIKQVACGFDYVVGLKKDGTLISCGRYYRCPIWSNVIYFDTFQCYYGQPFTIAILSDGSVVCDWTDEVNNWRDVIKVRAGNNGYAVGLKKDGTAYAISHDSDFVSKVESWHDIVDIECKYNTSVAILSDGRIVSTR